MSSTERWLTAACRNLSNPEDLRRDAKDFLDALAAIEFHIHTTAVATCRQEIEKAQAVLAEIVRRRGIPGKPFMGKVSWFWYDTGITLDEPVGAPAFDSLEVRAIDSLEDAITHLTQSSLFHYPPRADQDEAAAELAAGMTIDMTDPAQAVFTPALDCLSDLRALKGTNWDGTSFAVREARATQRLNLMRACVQHASIAA